MNIELEYEGSKKQLDDYEEFKGFIMLLNGDILDSYSNNSVCYTVNGPISPDGALKVNVKEKPEDGAEDDAFSTEFFILPDGHVMYEKRNVGFITYGGVQMLTISAKTRAAFITEDAYDFGAAAAFMG